MYEVAAVNESFLYAVYAWGIDLIRIIQSIQSSGLTAFMKIVSSLGAEYFYIVIILLIFWFVDEKKGFSLGLLIIISAWINGVLKVAFGQPRPFEFDPSLGLAFEPTRGFPSGHAQFSMTFWIAIACWLTFSLIKSKKFRPLIWSVSILFILLIGFSRLYLGVHFPTDVFGGWILALIILGIYFLVEKRAASFFAKTGTRFQLIIAAGVAFIMLVLHREDASFSAMVLGFSAGYSLMIKKFPFAARPAGRDFSFLKLGLRFLVGIAGAAIIYFGLKIVIPGTGSLFEGITALEPYYELGRFIRYALLGLWVSAGAPWVFLKYGLASSGIPAAPETPKENG